MAVQTVPYALQNASHSAAVFRQATSGPFVSGGALAAGELAVTQQGTPNMSVILGPGRAKVVGNSVSPPTGLAFTTQAMYDTLNDANLTLTIATSNPTNPRIDVVYIQVQDSFYSGASNQAVAGVATGTPAASPAVPSVPTNAIALYYVAVAANTTTIVSGNLSRVVSVATLLGGNSSLTDLNALAALTGMATGALVDVVEGGAIFEYSGTTWVQQTPATFASSTARDTAYAKASGAYLVQGAQVRRTDVRWTEEYSALYNSGSNPVGVPTIGWVPVAGTTINAAINALYNYTGGVSTANGTGTDIPWTAATINNLAGAFTVTLATGLFVCALPGTYEFDFDLEWTANGTGNRGAYYNKAVAATPTTFVPNGLNSSAQFLSLLGTNSSVGRFIVTLAVGDVIKFGGIQTSGGALTVSSATLRVQKLV